MTALYWYASIFLVLFLTGVGLPPAPEEAGILYAASVNALHEEVTWPLAWLACGLGIVAADCALYGIGRKWGARLFEYRWVQRVLSAEKRRRLEGHFASHGIKLLLLARFLPPVRTGVFLIAGATRYSFAKFLLADLIYAVVGVGAFFFFGAWLLALVHRFESTAAFLIALGLLLFGLYRYYRLLARRWGRAAPDAPISILQGPEGNVAEGQPAKDVGAARAAQAEAKAALE